MPTWDNPLITIVTDKCRMCYACVRECPAKAIRVVDGQASVIQPRCIGCGNCLRVCSQNAKQVRDDTERTFALLESPDRVAAVAAMVAPSFPAEFTDMVPGELVAMVRRLGFTSVHEVAYGADLVAAAYGRLLDRHPGRRFIATTCPAIVSYVERFHPDLVQCLAPVVSPMVATARALRRLLGPDVKVVFVGPCLAKKEEAVAEQVHGEVDAVLMFGELRQMFAEDGLLAGGVPPSDFDPPLSGRGALFPLSRGMLQAAGISEDLTRGDVVAADGRAEFQDAIREFENGDLDARLLEVLCCTGCVMGPGMTTGAPLFGRRSRVSEYVRDSLARRDADQIREGIEQLADLDLSRSYARDD